MDNTYQGPERRKTPRVKIDFFVIYKGKDSYFDVLVYLITIKNLIRTFYQMNQHFLNELGL